MLSEYPIKYAVAEAMVPFVKVMNPPLSKDLFDKCALKAPILNSTNPLTRLVYMNMKCLFWNETIFAKMYVKSGTNPKM